MPDTVPCINIHLPLTFPHYSVTIEVELKGTVYHESTPNLVITLK